MFKGIQIPGIHRPLPPQVLDNACSCIADALFGAPPQTSAHHARVEKKDGDHVVTDLGSKAGTWLNDRRLEPNSVHILHPGAATQCSSLHNPPLPPPLLPLTLDCIVFTPRNLVRQIVLTEETSDESLPLQSHTTDAQLLTKDLFPCRRHPAVWAPRGGRKAQGEDVPQEQTGELGARLEHRRSGGLWPGSLLSTGADTRLNCSVYFRAAAHPCGMHGPRVQFCSTNP